MIEPRRWAHDGSCCCRCSANFLAKPYIISPVLGDRVGTMQRWQGLVPSSTASPMRNRTTRDASATSRSSQNASTPSISRLALNRCRTSSNVKPANQPAISVSVEIATKVGPGDSVSSGNPFSEFSITSNGMPKYPPSHRDNSPRLRAIENQRVATAFDANRETPSLGIERGAKPMDVRHRLAVDELALQVA